MTEYIRNTLVFLLRYTFEIWWTYVPKIEFDSH